MLFLFQLRIQIYEIFVVAFVNIKLVLVILLIEGKRSLMTFFICKLLVTYLLDTVYQPPVQQVLSNNNKTI